MRWMKQAWIPVRGFWSAHPTIDWVIVVMLLLFHALALHKDWINWTLADLDKLDRARLYQTMATVSSLLFGFATASIAFFYGSAKGDRLDLLKQVMSTQLVRTWKAALGAPLLTVAVTSIALIVDMGTAGRPWVAWAVTGSLLMLALRAIRLRWLFAQTLRLLSHDITNPQLRTSLSVEPRPRKLTKGASKRKDTPIVF